MTPNGAPGSIQDALVFATSELRGADIATPRLDAEVLLGFLMGKTRTQLAIDAREPLDPALRLALGSLVRRRIAGESVAYLTGAREFRGIDFAVGPGVLVPRPETELLIERALDVIQRIWPMGRVRVLDLCTGSGAIALALASETDSVRVFVTGSDISTEALDYARRNRATLALDDRVQLVQGDLLGWTGGPWDLILSNPPYLRADQIDRNPDLAAEPRLALDGGRHGLEIVERILDEAARVVAPSFALIIEIDPDQATSVHDSARQRFPAADVSILNDLAGRARFISIERKEHLP